ncbi:hypothetical protein OG361_05940 [Streptomyces sp. NBC_00090]|uniref:hypothetical protein n=1 Tax=Streptomyces sp. NBC_00090 TaxID=2903619 RepID=UPI003248D449
MPAAGRDHPIETPVRRPPLKIGTTTATKPKAAKKAELRKQRKRLQEAAKRRLAARNSRRPRSRQSRIGNAAARRDARALSRVRHSNAWLW